MCRIVLQMALLTDFKGERTNCLVLNLCGIQLSYSVSDHVNRIDLISAEYDFVHFKINK